jgi:hypothetical protein
MNKVLKVEVTWQDKPYAVGCVLAGDVNADTKTLRAMARSIHRSPAGEEFIYEQLRVMAKRRRVYVL